MNPVCPNCGRDYREEPPAADELYPPYDEDEGFIIRQVFCNKECYQAAKEEEDG